MGDAPAKLTRLYPLLSNLWFSLPSQSPSSVNDFALFFRDKLGGTKWDISYFATTHFLPLLISALIFFFPVILSAIKTISSTWALDLFLSLYSFIFPTPHCTYLLLLSFPPWYKSKNKLKTSLIPISFPAIAFSLNTFPQPNFCVLYTLILQSTAFYSLYPLCHHSADTAHSKTTKSFHVIKSSGQLFPSS